MVLSCGSEDEKPPDDSSVLPLTQSIDEIYEDFGLAPSHAPYIDEKTAELGRRLVEKDSEIETLEKEVERLNSENKTLSNSVNNGGKPTSKADNQADKKSEVSEFEATFYTAYCPTGCTGVTATGVDVSNTIYHAGKRVIAVDPSVIPLGSSVKVTLEGGNTFEATAQDTGGDIKGNRIDILVGSREEAYALGRQTVKVEVIK